MRKLVRAAALVGAIVVVTATATPAFAGNVTQPTKSPFVVPANGAGDPLPFTVQGSGFDPGGNVYIEQCDGTSPSAAGWDPTINCDLGTAPAPSTADASGNVTFASNDVNHRFTPFKGDSPQGLFACRAPQDPPTVSGSPSFTSCQVRMSSNNTTGTSDQVFFRLTLPNPTVKLSCALKGTMGFNKPLTNVPPKKPKATKVKGSATLGTAAGTACNNSHVPAGATKYPVTSGSMKIKGAIPAGAKCSVVKNPNLSGIVLSIKWAGLKAGALKNAGKSTVVVNSSAVVALPTGGYVVSGPITAGAFAGSTARLQLALNGGVQSESNQCNGSSLAVANFTGANPSSIAVL